MTEAMIFICNVLALNLSYILCDFQYDKKY